LVFPLSVVFRGEVDQLVALRREWKRIEVQPPLELHPAEGAFLAPAVEPLEEGADADEVKVMQFRFIEYHAEVVEVTVEPSSCIGPELPQRLRTAKTLLPAYNDPPLRASGHARLPDSAYKVRRVPDVWIEKAGCSSLILSEHSEPTTHTY